MVGDSKLNVKSDVERVEEGRRERETEGGGTRSCEVEERRAR